MAHRKKIDDINASTAECYYCKATIPETAMRCPNCGKFFSVAKQLAVLTVVLIVVVAGAGAGLYFYMGTHQGYENGPEPEPNPNPTESNRYVNMVTSLGTIKVEMYEDTAPVTAGHFVGLVQSGAFSTGASFYRAEPGFVIQGGLQSSSSQTVAWEDNGLMNTQYTISMARSGNPDDSTSSGTGSSEFFINLGDNTQSLNTNVEYDYVVFGKVVAGTDIVNQIEGLPTHNVGTSTNPLMYIDNPLTITSMTISES